MHARPLILNCSPFDSRKWKWFDGQLDAGFLHVDSTPHNAAERLLRKPAIARYRAALQGGWRSRRADLLVTHSPDLTAWTELARTTFASRAPHLAFAFNFTRLPENWRRRVMTRAFRTVDRFVVFSRFERELYAQAFGIPTARIEMIYWGVGDPLVTTLPQGVRRPYICAVGGEGRDYTTFLAAMAALPHIRAVVVARPHGITTSVPPNVTVHTNIPPGEANAIIRHSQFMVLPLLHTEVPCGHVTMVSAMKLSKALVVTGSLGIADYVLPGKTALLCEPQDVDAMADRISTLWNDEASTESFGRAAKEFADRHFTESSTLVNVRRIVAEMTDGEVAVRGI